MIFGSLSVSIPIWKWCEARFGGSKKYSKAVSRGLRLARQPGGHDRVAGQIAAYHGQVFFAILRLGNLTRFTLPPRAVMITQDIFVGIVAIALGVVVTASALMNTPAFSRFWITRRIESSFGSGASRMTGALAGLAIAAIGVLLLTGVLPLKKACLAPLPATDLPTTGCMVWFPDCGCGADCV
jgi:hypothetical protein